MTSTTRKRPKNPLDHEPEAVKYARSNSGLTTQQLADLCGVSKSLVVEIENGTRNASPAMLNKLARALNCPRVVLERKRVDLAESEPQAAPPAAVGVPAVRDEERADSHDMPELRQLGGA